jgi:hypothetical protein
MQTQDSIYARRPWTSLPESIVDDQLIAYTKPASVIARTRPPIPNIGRTARRFGYQRNEIGIGDIAHLEQIYPRVDYTGSPASYSGTLTPALGVM